MSSLKITEIQQNIIQIQKDFTALLRNENNIYKEYENKIDRATEERYNSLKMYSQCEKESAERLRDGAYYEIDNDFERQKEDLSTRIDDYILFKYKLLAEEFTDAESYFAKSNSEFAHYFHMKYEKIINSQPIVELSDEPLLSEGKINEILQNSTSLPPYAIQGKVLSGPKGKYSIGSSATIKIGDALERHVIIQSISDFFISFQFDNGKISQVPIRALNMGLASIIN